MMQILFTDFWMGVWTTLTLVDFENLLLWGLSFGDDRGWSVASQRCLSYGPLSAVLGEDSLLL